MPADLLARVDAQPGFRTAFVVRALEVALDGAEGMNAPSKPVLRSAGGAVEGDGARLADCVRPDSASPRVPVPAIPGLKPARAYEKPFKPQEKGAK